MNERKHHPATTSALVAFAQAAFAPVALAHVVWLLAGAFAASHAREASATFAVGATVTAAARLESQSVPTVLDVAPADVERGYIDVAAPTTLVVRSNSPTGFAIDLSTMTPMLAALEVHGLETVASLGAAGGSLVQRWQRPGSMNLVLRFRLFLAPGVAAGQYTWPVHIDVRPLTAA